MSDTIDLGTMEVEDSYQGPRMQGEGLDGKGVGREFGGISRRGCWGGSSC